MHVGHFRLGTLANIWPLDSFKTEPKVCAVGNVAHTPAKHAKSCQVRCMKVKVTTYTSYRVIVSFLEGQETILAKTASIQQICDPHNLVSYLAFPERSQVLVMKELWTICLFHQA
jgi:hypothetical protein